MTIIFTRCGINLSHVSTNKSVDCKLRWCKLTVWSGFCAQKRGNMTYSKEQDLYYRPRFFFPYQEKRWILNRFRKRNLSVLRYVTNAWIMFYSKGTGRPYWVEWVMDMIAKKNHRKNTETNLFLESAGDMFSLFVYFRSFTSEMNSVHISLRKKLHIPRLNEYFHYRIDFRFLFF